MQGFFAAKPATSIYEKHFPKKLHDQLITHGILAEKRMCQWNEIESTIFSVKSFKQDGHECVILRLEKIIDAKNFDKEYLLLMGKLHATSLKQDIEYVFVKKNAYFYSIKDDKDTHYDKQNNFASIYEDNFLSRSKTAEYLKEISEELKKIPKKSLKQECK